MHVILLRERDSEVPDEDRYESAISSHLSALHLPQVTCSCIPPISYKFINVPLLLQSILPQYQGIIPNEHPLLPPFCGLIFTSKRAISSIRNALTNHAVLPASASSSSNITIFAQLWSSKLIYCVGPETASLADGLGLEPRGPECGAAAALADLIISEQREDPKAEKLPFLFICGRKHRDELPSALESAKIPFTTIEVYEGEQRTTFEEELPSITHDDWVVFFSPAGVQTAFSSPQSEKWAAARKAAIGPTTAQAIQDVGWTVEATAKKPTPEALAEALSAAIENPHS